MKKIFSILIGFCMVRVACGCSDRQETYINDDMFHMLTLSYGANDVCSVNGAIYKIDLSDDGKSSVIKYIDKAGAEEIPLCSRIECSHSDDTCTAYIDDSSPYIFSSYNGEYIYIVHKSFTDDGFTTSISSMRKNGEDRKEIYRLKSGESFLFPIMAVGYNNTLFIMKYSFLDTDIEETLVQIDCRTGENKDICKFDNGSSILGADGEKLFVCTEPYTGENQTTITVLDLEKNEINKNIIPNDGNHAYFYCGKNIYRINGKDKLDIQLVNLSDKSCNTVYTNENYSAKWSFEVSCVIDDLVIISYRDADNNTKRLAYDFSSDKTYDLTLKITGEDEREAFVTILGYTDEYYYVAANSALRDMYYLTPAGTYEKGRYTVIEKRFMKKSDYLNNTEKYI